VSLERNIEKRPGFEVVPQYTIPDRTDWDFTDYDTRVDLYRLAGVGLPDEDEATIETKDFWYYWHNINEDNRYLVVVDFKARTTDKNLFYIFQILPNGTWKDVTPGLQTDNPSSVPEETRAYLTFGSDASDLGTVKTAAESLQAVSVGTNIVILNKNVYAGFTSDEDGFLFNLKGEKTTTPDIAGRPITYYTAAEVIKVINAGSDNRVFTEDDIVLGYRPLSAVRNDIVKEITVHTSDPLVVDVVLGDLAVSQGGAYVGYELKLTTGPAAGSNGTIIEYFGATKTARVSWTGPVPQISGTISGVPYRVDAKTFEAIPVKPAAYQIPLPSGASDKKGEYNGGTFAIKVGSTWETCGTVTTYEVISSTDKYVKVKGWGTDDPLPVIGSEFRITYRKSLGSRNFVNIFQTFTYTGTLTQNSIPLHPANAGKNALVPYENLPVTYGIPLAAAATQTLNGSIVSAGSKDPKRAVVTSSGHGLIVGQKVYIDAADNAGTSWVDADYEVSTVVDSSTFTVIATKDVYTTSSFSVTIKKTLDDYYNNYRLSVQFVSNPGSGKVVKYTTSNNVAFVTNWEGDAPLNGNSYNIALVDTEYEITDKIYNGVNTVNITTPGSTGVDGTPATTPAYNNVQLEYHSGAVATEYPKANITITNGEVTACQIVSNYRGTGFTYASFTSNPTVMKVTTGGGIPATFRCTVSSLFLQEEAKHIPVEDYSYFQKSLSYLGQKVNDASEIRLPPAVDDWYEVNTNSKAPIDLTAGEMLKELYDPLHPYGKYTSEDGRFINTNLVQGRGKIYFCANPFLSLTSGYYRVISWAENAGNQWATIPVGSNIANIQQTKPANAANWVEIKPEGRPYLQKVRTPEKWSVIDHRRMPQKLGLNVGSWTIGPIRWTPRQSGNNDSNPGPSIFKTTDRAALKQTQIISIAVFKDRLWFAADDVAFSSQIGDYESFFIDDPSNIVATDPIDIRASSNSFAQITHMVPFEDYIFINTKANTQFQLTAGSRNENDIVLTPFNVMLSPSTYYSAASFVDPQTIGSQLYFFDRRKLYLFTGKTNLGMNSAVEVSATANDYLPENYGFACVGHAQNSVFVTDADNPNHIYIYTIRFSGERVIQNSFYRYVLDEESAVYSLQVYDKYLYAVIHKNDRVLVERTLLKDEHPIIPRMDHMFKVRISTLGENPNTTYNPGLHETTYRLPTANYSVNDTFRVVIAPPAIQNQEDISGVAFPPLVSIEDDGAYMNVVVLGRFDTEGANVYIGNPFRMEVELSPLFIRDENGNIVDGTLNLRTVVVRHFNTGNYDIEVTHRGRKPIVSSFTAIRPDFTIQEDALPLEAWAQNGEFVGKVFGFSESTKIKLVSEYITPVNISAIEFKGKFKQKYSVIN
jgi:hypothetical protein